MPDDKKGPTPTPPDDWRTIAEKASKEQDSKKLSELVKDLCDRLDQRNADRKRRKAP